MKSVAIGKRLLAIAVSLALALSMFPATFALADEAQTGTLVVTNTVNCFTNKDDVKPDPEQQFQFTVTLSDTSIAGSYGAAKFENGSATFKLLAGESLSITDLPAGVEYTVSEAYYGGTASNIGGSTGYATNSTGTTGIITANETSTAAFTNTYGYCFSVEIVPGGNDDVGWLNVTIDVGGWPGRNGPVGSFGDGVSNGHSVKIPIQAGKTRYFVTGIGYWDRTDQFSINIDRSGVEYYWEGEKLIIACNTYGSLIVECCIKGNDPDPNYEFNYTVTLDDTGINGQMGDMNFENGVATFKLKGGQSAEASDLPNGMGYTVTVDDPSEGGWTSEGSLSDGGTVVGDESVTSALTFIRNTYGSLKFTAKSASHCSEAADVSRYTVTFSDKSLDGYRYGITFDKGVVSVIMTEGSAMVIDHLPNGVTYSIEPAGDTATGWASVSSDATGTIKGNDTVTASIVKHKYGEWSSDGNASCTDDGTKTRKCIGDCGVYETVVDEGSALGHDRVSHEAKAATCTEDGWEAYDTCTRCDYSTYVEIPAKGHAIEEHEAKAATCTEAGWEAYVTCGSCDFSTYAETPALGHSPKAAAAIATVTAGSKCSECGTVLSGCKAKLAQSAASIATSKLTAKGLKSGKLKKTKSFALKATGAKEGPTATWKKANKAGGSKIVVKNGKLTVKKGLKKGTYKVKVTMTLATTANYKVVSLTKTIKVVVK